MSTEPQRDAPLGIDDLATVHNDIYSCRAKWYDIGLQLRVDVGTLESFKVDHQGSGNQLREVINAWLTSTTSKNPTWRVLAETLSKAAIGEAKLAKELQQKYCSSGQPPVHADSISEEKPHEKRKATSPEPMFCSYSAEGIKFLDIIQKLGKLERVYRFVESCEVFVQERCVKLVGTPEGCQQAKKKFDDILEHSKKETVSLPEYVLSTVGEDANKCMEKNEGVLVLPAERKIRFIAEDEEHCKKAIEWMRANAYPFALQFKETGKYFPTTSMLQFSTPVEAKAAPEAIRAKYLHPPGHGRMELKQVIHGMGSSEDLGTIRAKLEGIFGCLEHYQTKLRVGYEVRFGHALWKPRDYARPRNERKILDHFRKSCGYPRFCPGVHTSIQEVLARCVDTPDPVKKLLDPVRLEVTRYDGSKANCVAVIDELEDGRFMLVNVFYDQGALGKPKFDLILPDRKYDVRIALNFAPAPAVEQYGDDKQYEETYKIAEKFTSSIHRRSDDTLLMKVRGPNYHVGYLRQKKQTQHKWKANEKWTLAVYNVQEFQMKKKEIDNWEVDKEVELPLTAPKKEVELWNQKRIGDFGPRSHWTKGHYADVRSTTDMRLPKEDTPRKGSRWTTAEMMEDFNEFVAAALEIADLLTQLQ